MTTNNRGFAQTLWDFFCSLKLSIFLLIGLALTSIIGTVIPQAPVPQEYLQTITPFKMQLYEKLGFFDMYHSWWFILLLYLLTVNLIACSIKRLPRVWKIVSEPTLVMDEGFERSLSHTHEIKAPGSAPAMKDKMAAFLKAEFAEPTVTEAGGEYHLFAQKSPYCRLGVYVVHLSIIIIFIGALIGSFFGYKAYVNIAEGTGVDSVESRSGKNIPLGFSVRCEKFAVSFYDTGAPKEFKSILTVFENGKPVPDYENVKVIVNDPLTYKGITFYQSSYGAAGDTLYRFSVRSRNGGQPVPLIAHEEDRVPLPDGGFMQIIGVAPEVGSDFPGCSGPGAKLEITRPNGKKEYAIVLLNPACRDFDEKRGSDLIFTFDGKDEKFYTGLQVAKDPGVWVVWLGCSLMVVGICMAFFMSHKRIWIRVANGRVTLGGTASKNPAGFELLFQELAAKLDSSIK
ncbi:cytochrome c biogenesis protein ResB [Geotalea toluenoxydans]|uniref:cytochrome c biogenesis protein ResB n=1 Tax=Geotalea toluenoxydans TaxID=421624 RepID=UPI0006CFDE76|nr:cytochrome c biogenesis protein ResB [Geotalea toluenoxydans]